MERESLAEETKQEFSEVEFFGTGSTLLDKALGGGWALGRIFNIVGDRSSGKTLLAIEGFANFKRAFPKGRMRYGEAESAFDESFAETLGFPDEVEQPEEQLNTVEDFQRDFYEFIKKPGPSLYILDSLDALSDEAEIDKFKKEAEGKQAPGSMGAQKAKEMSRMFRVLTSDAAKANCALGIISQIRDRIGVTFGETKMRTGGHALDFYASQVLWLAEIGKIKKTALGEERAIGVNVHAKVKKCKVGMPFRECQFPIMFGYGVDDEASMLAWLESTKTITKDAAKIFNAQVQAAREKNDWQKVREVHAELKRIAVELWDKIEDRLAPPMRKYE